MGAESVGVRPAKILPSSISFIGFRNTTGEDDMSNTNNNNYTSSTSSASSPRVKRHLTHADLTEDERRENPYSRDSVRPFLPYPDAKETLH